jgi:hypothetical protein
MDYSWWTARCKTEGCPCVLLLHNIGPAQKYRHTVRPLIGSFTEKCPGCEASHEYEPFDVEERTVNDPSNDSSPAFLEVIRKAAPTSHEDSDEGATK